jgi:hypothetical protein
MPLVYEIFDERLNRYGGKRDIGQLLYYLTCPKFLISYPSTGCYDYEIRQYIIYLLGELLYKTEDTRLLKQLKVSRNYFDMKK